MQGTNKDTLKKHVPCSSTVGKSECFGAKGLWVHAPRTPTLTSFLRRVWENNRAGFHLGLALLIMFSSVVYTVNAICLSFRVTKIPRESTIFSLGQVKAVHPPCDIKIKHDIKRGNQPWKKRIC